MLKATEQGREIVEQGYRGKAGMVRSYISNLRRLLSLLSPEDRLRIMGSSTNFNRPSRKRAMW